jgi:hypothetical protein
MGLGKTMEMLGLILANPMKEAPKNGSFFSTKATLSKLRLLSLVDRLSLTWCSSHLSESLDCTMGVGDREAYRAQVNRVANTDNDAIQKIHLPTSPGCGYRARNVQHVEGQELYCVPARAASDQVWRELSARTYRPNRWTARGTQEQGA